MSLAQIQSLLKDLAEFQPTIVLTGGEPFTRKKEISTIVREAKSLGMKIGIFTNGTSAPENILRDVVDAGVDWLSISLDGPKSVYESVTGVAGSFDRVIRTIKLLAEYCNGKSTSITLSAVLSEQSIDDIDFVLSFLASERVSLISLLHYHFLTQHDLSENVLQFEQLGIRAQAPAINRSISPSNGIFVNKVLALQRRLSGKKNISFVPPLSLGEVETWYGDPSGFPVREKCFYPWATARIAPDGTVYPCQNHVIPLGNVVKENFKDIWNGNSFQAFRAALAAKGMFPGCNRCCKTKTYTRAEFPNQIPTVFP
jgi:radical SAM protein with 4Fe4S-binding SPASM domain